MATTVQGMLDNIAATFGTIAGPISGQLRIGLWAASLHCLALAWKVVSVAGMVLWQCYSSEGGFLSLLGE